MTVTIVHRPATLSDLEQILDWAAEEGWNPGLQDAPAFFAADPDGFFLAEKDGRAIAAISVVNHSDRYAFLGLYLCRPEHRGKGIGFALWQHALTHAGDRTVGLDGVPAQEANYAKSGFVLVDRTRRLTGTLPVTPAAGILAGPGDVDAILRLDAEANGYPRARYIGAWVTGTTDRKTVVLRDGAALTGFATARRCREGVKIGPVIAPDAGVALHLAAQAAAAFQTASVIVDVPDVATDFGASLSGAGFVETFATARMYRGSAPAMMPNLHAVCTLELG
jgi:GNAT superfamily N-acetyltransferase